MTGLGFEVLSYLMDGKPSTFADPKENQLLHQPWRVQFILYNYIS